MKTSYYQDVLEFRAKFGLDAAIVDSNTMWQEVLKKRLHISEELDELDANVFVLGEEDRHETADAIGDLIYVLCGLAAVLKIPLDEVWERIHAANMQKVRVSSAAESKRNDPFDLKKPDGWSPPVFDDIMTKGFPFDESMK